MKRLDWSGILLIILLTINLGLLLLRVQGLERYRDQSAQAIIIQTDINHSLIRRLEELERLRDSAGVR